MHLIACRWPQTWLRSVALAALLISACGGSSSPSGGLTASAPGVTKDTITIGTSMALTGSVAVVGLTAKAGAEAYFNAINKAGGVNGRKISWTVLDDAYSGPKATANTRALVEQDNAFALFMYFGGAATNGALPYVQSNNIPLVTAIATSEPYVTPVIPTFFTFFPQEQDEADVATQYVINTMGKQKIAIIYPNTAPGDNALTATKRTVAASNAQLVASVTYDQATPTDFVAQVATLKASNADALFLAANTIPNTAKIITQAAAQGWHPQFYTDHTGADATTLQLAGAAANGIVGISFLKLTDSSDPAVVTYRQALAATGEGVAPNIWSEDAYASAALLVDAIKRAGQNPTRDSLIQALNQTKNFASGVTGPVSFSTSLHVAPATFLVVQGQAGKFVALTPNFVSPPAH